MSFKLEECTIAEIHNAYENNELTCVELTQLYLSRIEKLDQAGPSLNAFVKLDPSALDQARILDDYYQENGRFKGVLHGVPIAIKDQAETKNLETSFGSKALIGNIPEEDATIVKKLKDAGAIIVGKTTMPDFAASWWGYGSVHGETKCAYDLERDSGGSSGGTGAAVAANLVTVGIGEDTGGSIRLPSSANNLVGIRVTPGMISRNGLSPLLVLLDTAGPMARNVTDVAKLLDVLVGYDPQDPYTDITKVAKIPESYTDELDCKPIKSLRLGILKEAFGDDSIPEYSEVNSTINKSIDQLKKEGATFIEVSIPDLDEIIADTSLYISRSRYDLNQFLQKRGFKYKNIEEIVEKGLFEKKLELLPAIITDGPSDPLNDPEYYKRVSLILDLQQKIQNIMASKNLDGICFPSCKILTPKFDDLRSEKWTVLTFPTNTVVASQSLLPSICIPAGFSKENIPVGMEIISYRQSEKNLLQIAYSIESHLKNRRAPKF